MGEVRRRWVEVDMVVDMAEVLVDMAEVLVGGVEEAGED
jgi:hypothetical protein